MPVVTYGHRLKKTRDPVRSPFVKLQIANFSTMVGDYMGIVGAVCFCYPILRQWLR
ncbi:hypothetical protein BJ508DRAFT_413383 [Ascobolus immersus RN42]|uniref:Uncharacterized protein n=1 Tax=Ascobolus immersus RN42 TaxID=1160509 RepID=A0A3N4ICA7_ASCIM|nr:hypothetical protein BJ508DRAFT_413383 [Ascobolus immersus RN42]